MSCFHRLSAVGENGVEGLRSPGLRGTQEGVSLRIE